MGTGNGLLLYVWGCKNGIKVEKNPDSRYLDFLFFTIINGGKDEKEKFKKKGNACDTVWFT